MEILKDISRFVRFHLDRLNAMKRNWLEQTMISNIKYLNKFLKPWGKLVESNPINTEQEKNYYRKTSSKNLDRSNIKEENIQIMIMKFANSSAFRKSKISRSDRK